VERLRAWDRRYGLAPAHRVGRTRFYDRAQLARLTRIKQLIDQGQKISNVVGLSDEQLASRLTSSREITGYSPRIGLIGPNLLILEHESDTSVQVVARWANMNAFASAPARFGQLDVIVVQLPSLAMQSIEEIEAAHANARILVLYQFATEKLLRRARNHGATALQWPLSWSELENSCVAGAASPLRASRAAPRRFTDEQLIYIATSATDPSQSPQHLVKLITRLNAFADHSLHWQSADEAPADTAVLHERVYSDVTLARAQLESALETWAEAQELLTQPM